MKKIPVMITAALLACTLGATGAWAAGARRGTGCRQGTAPLCRFVDRDGDGVCDNRLPAGCRYDADGDGLCDRAGTGTCAGGQHCRI